MRENKAVNKVSDNFLLRISKWCNKLQLFALEYLIVHSPQLVLTKVFWLNSVGNSIGNYLEGINVKRRAMTVN